MNTSSTRPARLLLAGAALGVAALTAGCAGKSTVTVTAPPAAASSSAASAASATSAPATSAPAATSAPSASAAGGGGGGAANPAQAGGSGCQGRYLRADVGLSQGAAGSAYQVITFTNLNNEPCTLYGYPGVSLANGTPVTQVGAAADRDHTVTPTLVTLQPQGIASFTLRVVDALNFPTAACQPVATTWLQIYPPDQFGALYVPFKSTGCSNSASHVLTVGVVKPGNGG